MEESRTELFEVRCSRLTKRSRGSFRARRWSLSIRLVRVQCVFCHFLLAIHLVDLPVQRPPADPELLRRGSDVAAGAAQGLVNQLALRFMEIERAHFPGR